MAAAVPLLCRVAVLLLIATTARAFYGANSKVIELTATNFQDKVLNTFTPVLVEFYSPGCPHCRNMIATWEKVADNLAGHVDTAAINCQEHNAICQRYQISGVPSFKIFVQSDKNQRIFVDYTEGRDAQSIVGFAKRQMTSFVWKISGKPDPSNSRSISLDSFLQKGAKLPKAILFKPDGAAVSMALKSLSVRFYRKIVVGIVNSKLDKEAADRFNVSANQETFIVLSPNDLATPITYGGKMAFTPLADFLQKQADTKWPEPKSEL